MSKKHPKNKWVDWNRQRPADVSAGKVIMLTSIYADTEDGANYMSGDVVEVARGITTGMGRQYRIMGSNTWVGDYQVIADSKAQAAARQNPDRIQSKGVFLDNVVSVNKVSTEFISKQKSVKIKTVIENSRTRAVSSIKSRVISPNNVSKNKEKNITMDKSVLKTTIASLTPGQVISLTFIGAKSHLSRDWTVVKTKTGKGKGGSKLMELVDNDKNTITTGTPESQFILNMTIDGNMIGYASEADVPVVFEKDTAKATELKSAFKVLKGAEGNKTVTITATVPELTGTFTVNKQTQLRGRGGQIRLDLARVGTDEVVEAWSLRHSGIIQTFVVDSDEAA